METKSNYILVGAITLVLLAALVAFTIWLARFNEGAQKEYDIFFQQVNGLAKGTSVAFSGVPVGQIEEIKLWEPDPEYVRVRIKVDQNTPILLGTVATIAGVGFTGVSEIQLDGAVKGAVPLACPEEKPETACPAGAPIIPVKRGALGELLNNAPLLLERLSTLSDRMNNMLSADNQKNIQNTLVNVEKLTGSLAQAAPQLQLAITETQSTIRKIGGTADSISALASDTDNLINSDGKAAFAKISKTLENANASIAQLEKTLKAAQPGVDAFSNNTLPQINALTRDLRDASKSLKGITERLDQEGAGSLLGAPPLPDYEPKK